METENNEMAVFLPPFMTVVFVADRKGSKLQLSEVYCVSWCVCVYVLVIWVCV